MSIPIINSATSLFLSFTGTAANIATTLGSVSTMPGVEMWLFVTNSACFIAQGANPTASAGAGSVLVSPNFPILIDATFGAKLSVIQDAVAGKATLTKVMLINR